MGGKGSAPATPDYMGATQLQGELNKENLNTQNYANRPTINTPFGTQSWGTQSVTDPATGQVVTAWTQNNTLAPGLQNSLQDQINIQAGRSSLANNFMGRVANEYGTSPDYSNMPNMAQAAQPASLQTGTTDYVPGLSTSFNFGNPQASLNLSDNPALPQFDSSYRDTVANTLMERMQPTHDYQQRQLETRLSNMGFRPGTEGYDRELRNLNNRQASERFNALDSAGNEAQRLYNMQMGTAQQAFNQDLQGGQFANQAQSQGYQQNLGAAQFKNQSLGQANALDLANMQAGNQAAAQQYGLNQQFANAQNQLRQQAITEMLQRRGTSLNEMNALLSGQQVNMPQMPSFNQSGMAQTPNIMGALQSQYDAQLGAANAQNANFNNLLGAGAQLGSAAFMFSDRRLKSNIRRVGTHASGVGIYDYTMMGTPQRGVIAQEVQAVRPDLVKRHANGYLMVNYGGL
ncbi:Intramolecular chaperone auto-processing domain containing protein [uncultured Caudovirales phage]|uniref:Intramolecular chaperone auto-processing domain containing protein n=1 Tax=uncultured Caudovirales phage TaxID=2100421 RepID=A0A6J5LY51_9CAUD|nr:Intramolecular chaperone auto-processing domain containing protein [uncultured Caudovirales phage]